MFYKISMLILKIVGIVLLLVATGFGYLYYTSTYYDTYSLKAEKAAFPKVTTKVDIDQLAEKLVTKMSLEEKIDQMYGEKSFKGWSKMMVNWIFHETFPRIYVGKNDRLNIPPFVLSDGPRGARVISRDTRGVTTFPVAMARGASWDTDLEARINEVIAIEMRANGTNYAATPCINILRHPGWGRAQEVYGEDPWHMGEFGVAATRAIQQHNVMACPKHFALNSVENSRTVIDVEVEERTLREVYLPHFKRVVQEGEAASLMSAYNSVRGSFMSDNEYLLSDILRDEWGFQGFISSDWFMGTHDAKRSIKAGMDIEMPVQNIYQYDKVKAYLESGEISEAEIDKMVLRILKTRLPYAFAEDRMDYAESLLASKDHTDLALEAAEKSMVLIKNQDVLPFSKNSGKKIALIGRLADLENTGDHGSSNSRPAYVVTPYEALKSYHERLGNEVILNDGSDLASAIDLAQQSDEVVLMVGYAAGDEGEYILIDLKGQEYIEASAKAGKLVGKRGIGGDRETLRLPQQDEALITALSPVNKNLAVVYVGGSAIDLSDWEEKAPAILFAWYGGMEGGNALARVLYGDYNPSGKLPFSIARNEADYPYFTPYAMKIKYDYYHGYTLFDKKEIAVAYPFGHGLSYTSFSYNDLQIINPKVNPEDTLLVSVDVTNTGDRYGEEVAQLYVGFSQSEVDRPVKLLRGFEKIALEPGETRTIEFAVKTQDLAYYDAEEKRWIVEEMEHEIYLGGSSRHEALLKGSFFIGL